jgi:glycosyltransferase involved in cell wall biosynthesis
MHDLPAQAIYSVVPRTLLLVENASVPSDPRVWPECKSLRRAGWEVVVVCPTGSPREQEPFEDVDGVEIHRFRCPENTGGAVGYVREYAVALTRMRDVVRRLGREHRFDVVHAATPPDVLLLAARSLRRRGTRTILDHHDLSPELFAAKYGRRGIVHAGLGVAERVGFALADVVVSTNESFRRIAIERGRKHPEDVFVVRNGPDPEVFRPVQGDSVLRRGRAHLLGYVGVMGRQDGVLDAVRALAALKRVRTDWRAIFVGTGDAAPEAEQLSTRLGLAEDVEFLGFVADRELLVKIIASCDVCLSPEPPNELNQRSTLIKVAEYMAVGRPVAAFNLAETRATAGEAALYARHGDPASFADTVDTLLDDPARRERMGRTGRERVERKLSWRHSEAALLRAYDRTLALGGAASQLPTVRQDENVSGA